MSHIIPWLISCIVALFFTWLISLCITESLKPHEVRNWETGKPIFDRPVTEEYAKSIKHQIENAMVRRDIISRRPPGIGAAITYFGLWLLTDPIKIALFIVFAVVSRKIFKRIESQMYQEKHREQ